MLKTFAELNSGAEFVDFSGGGSRWKKTGSDRAVCVDPDDGSFDVGEESSFYANSIACIEPGVLADYEAKAEQQSAARGETIGADADYVDMALAILEDRLFAMDPFDANEQYQYVVVAPGAMERFDGIGLVDVWIVDALGRKAPETLPITAQKWPSSFKSLKDIPSETILLLSALYAQGEGMLARPDLGKGALNCSIMKGGVVAREVSMKARLDVATMTVMVRGAPYLVAPRNDDWTGEDSLDFDPLTQGDPHTGERYTEFCYIDDAGQLFNVNPLNMKATRPAPGNSITSTEPLYYICPSVENLRSSSRSQQGIFGSADQCIHWMLAYNDSDYRVEELGEQVDGKPKWAVSVKGPGSNSNFQEAGTVVAETKDSALAAVRRQRGASRFENYLKQSPEPGDQFWVRPAVEVLPRFIKDADIPPLYSISGMPETTDEKWVRNWFRKSEGSKHPDRALLKMVDLIDGYGDVLSRAQVAALRVSIRENGVVAIRDHVKKLAGALQGALGEVGYLRPELFDSPAHEQQFDTRVEQWTDVLDHVNSVLGLTIGPAPAGNLESNARKLARFNEEFFGSFETIGAIAEEYNVRTLTDLVYLQAAILDGSYIDVASSYSDALEVLAQLPSGAEWTRIYTSEIADNGDLIREAEILQREKFPAVLTAESSLTAARSIDSSPSI